MLWSSLSGVHQLLLISSFFQFFSLTDEQIVVMLYMEWTEAISVSPVRLSRRKWTRENKLIIECKRRY